MIIAHTSAGTAGWELASQGQSSNPGQLSFCLHSTQDTVSPSPQDKRRDAQSPSLTTWTDTRIVLLSVATPWISRATSCTMSDLRCPTRSYPSSVDASPCFAHLSGLPIMSPPQTKHCRPSPRLSLSGSTVRSQEHRRVSAFTSSGSTSRDD